MLRMRGVPVGSSLFRAALGLGPRPGRAASGARGQGWLQPAGYDTGVKVYNSLTGRKDPLIVSGADAASWYSCGPTVYDHAHLGHACSYVRFDIIRRILTRVFGCGVIMVMGITDVDDKIITRANEMDVSPASLANLYEEDFKQDMAALKVLPPTVYLRVTENIPHIIAFIERIIANGHAYSTPKGNVYFDLQSRGDRYGKLVGVAPAPVGETGHLHVKGKEEKMSKSLKNYITIKDFLSTASPDVFRLFCLRSSYRSAMDYSDGAMLEARRLLRSVAAFVEDARAYMRGQLAGGPVQEDVLWERLGRTKGAVQAALADDFNTPGAVDAVVDLAHHGNRQLKAAAEAAGGPRSPAVFGAVVSYVEQFFETVGISLAERQCVSGAGGGPAALHSVVEELVRFRRKVRQFALATGEAPGEARRQLLERRPLLEACDALRRDLAAHGVSIKDRGGVSTWELLDPRTEDPKPGS
ncbi:probable cysteine--tRNA ligase, mitochondrial isoform X4 [Kogia breviceps]|uniref:probable cysteine--tRNA ligase, mitochondrial isoform X4 n=1 Tax=Kogia breviceps TaxID=27615 RepID=UPI0034D24ECE